LSSAIISGFISIARSVINRHREGVFTGIFRTKKRKGGRKWQNFKFSTKCKNNYLKRIRVECRFSMEKEESGTKSRNKKFTLLEENHVKI